MGERGLGEIEILKQDTGTLLPLLQQLQDMQTVGIAQGFEYLYALCG